MCLADCYTVRALLLAPIEFRSIPDKADSLIRKNFTTTKMRN